MDKKLGAWILSLLLSHFLLSCTSSTKEESGDSVADEIASEADEMEMVDGSDEVSDTDDSEEETDEWDSEEVASGDETDGEEGEEFDEEEAVEDELAAVEDEDEEDWEDEESDREVAQAEPTEQQEVPPAAEVVEQPTEVVTSEPIEPLTYMETSEVLEGPKWIPLKKIASQSFSKNGTLLNTVYIMREGDTLQSVSQKIYGSDRTSEILANNPHLSTSTKPGNKLYYHSPTRSADDIRMLTYYEDKAIPAETYTTKEGDNIREFAAGLLGFPDAWKEVWATNENVESKQFVEPGLNLRYWKEGAMPVDAGQKMASNETSSEASMDDLIEGGMSPEEFGGNETAMPPSHGKMESDPNIDQPSVAATTTLPPPPPPPPLPPEPPVVRAQPQTSASSLLGGDNMNYILLIVGCVALLGAGAFAIQKKNRKNLDFEYTTQA